jgi:hypothetical protein
LGVAKAGGRDPRSHLLPLALWTIAWGFFFITLLSGVDRLPNGDFAGQFHAFGLFQAREVAAGRLPLWSPGSFGGFPFAADTQAAVFYLPRWETLLLSLPWRFPYYALTVEALVHIWLAGIFTYFLAFDLTSRRGPALLAALAFGLGGYLVSYPVQQLAILETMTWLPLVLLLLRRGVAAGPDIRYLVAAGVVLGLAALAGHPQSLLHAAYLAAAYYLFLTRRARWRWTGVVGWGLLLAVIAAGTAAVALLPAARYAAETTRTAATYDYVSSGFPMVDFLQVVIPGALTVWSPQYVGLTAAVLAALGWFGRRRAGDDQARSEIFFWSAVALVSAWLSLGDNGILFELVYRIAPGFTLFRQQERLAGLFSLSLALLAAQGLALWLRAGAAKRISDGPLPVGRAILMIAALLLIAAVTLVAARSLAVVGWWLIWLRQLVVLGLIASVMLAWRDRPRLAVAALLLLLAGDLFLSTRPAMGLVRESPAVFWPQPDWMSRLQADKPGRVDSQNLFVANIGEIYELADIRGISPLKPEVVERYEALPRHLRWQLLNVTHVIAPEKLEDGLTSITPVDESIIPGETVAATLYRFEDALPRAWLATEVLVADDTDGAMTLLQNPDFDPNRQVVLLRRDAAVAGTISPVENPGNVQIETRPGGDISLTVEASSPAVLVVSEWYRSGWRAQTIGGDSRPLLLANGGLQGLTLPAGKHEILLQYRPWEVPAGFALSLVTLLVAISLVARRRPTVPFGSLAGGKTMPANAVIRAPAVRCTPIRTAERWILIFILLAGFGLRAYRLGYQELRGDEAFSYNFSQLALNEVIPELVDQGDPHPPLHYLLLNIWAGAVGVSEFGLRYLSVLAGTLLPAVLYALGRRMDGRLTGLIAAALAAIAPGLIWLGQDVRNQYVLVMLFSSLATLILIASPRKHAAGYWLLYLTTCVLTVYSHYFGAFALLAHGFYLGLTPGRRRDIVAWIACGLGTMLLLALWLAGSTQSLLQAGQLSDPSRPELARHLTLVGRDLTVGQTLGHSLDRWLFLGGLGLVLLGGIALGRSRRSNWASMLLAWLAIGVYAIYLIRFSRGTFNAFYGSIVAPPWWLLFSTGLVWLWRQGRWRRVMAVLAPAALGLAILVALGHSYNDPRYSRTIGYRAAAAHLAERAGPDDLFIVPSPDPVWDYYLRESDLPRVLLPATFGETATETEAALETLADAHDRLWFVPYAGWDREDVVARWLDYHMLHEEQTMQVRTDLRAYRSLASVRAIMRPVAQRVGDGIEMAGAYLTVDGRPPEAGEPVRLNPGAKVEVTFLWAATGPTDRSYTSFAHLLDEAGNLIAQHDGIPVEGTRSTTTWVEGEQLLDRHSLVVPEGVIGPVLLVAGLYDTETIERQTFEDGRTAWPIATFLVGPAE